MPIHAASGGYQWGSHGKVYPSRAGAEKQAAAAHAAGWAGDDAEQHWVTSSGSHLLVAGSGPDAKIVGGAGGKLNGPTKAAQAHAAQKAEPAPKFPVKPQQTTAAAPAAGEHAIGEAAHQAAQAAYTPKQREALQNYSGSSYETINPALRSGGNVPKESANDLKSIDSAFSAASTKAPMKVYRGIRGDVVKSLKNMSVGQSFKDNGFSSTSSDENKAGIFSRGDDSAIMEIRVPKGSKAISLNELSQFKGETGEQEILLNRGGTYTLKGIEQKKVKIPARAGWPAKTKTVKHYIMEYSE